MEEWRKYKISDLTIMKNGKKRPSCTGLIPVYGGNGIMDYTNVYNAENIVVVGRVGAYCGNVYHCPDKCWVSDNAIAISANNLIDIKYLFYLMSSLNLHHQHIGGAQPLMTQDIIGRFDVSIPRVETQKKIASILSSIDSKIALNRRINNNLEQQAQALFKSWFVDFEPFKNGTFIDSELGKIPEGWRVGSLGELVNIKYGKDYKKLSPGSIPVYGSGGIIRNVDKYLYNKESVLIPRKGTLNNVIYVNHPFWTVDTMFYTHMKTEGIAKFIYLLISPVDLSSMNSGSAVPSMTVDILNKIRIIIPPTIVLQCFDNIVKPLFTMKDIHVRENKNLSQLQNTLLPKLMSGKIDISNLNIE